jgi:hypothetical protein
MTAIAFTGIGLTGVLRITWVRDNLAHVLDHSHTDETSGTWTRLACPGHGLALGTDVDNATLQHLAAGSEIADLIWEAPDELTAEHAQVLRVTSWSFLTSHARVLLCIARDPGARLRDIAASLDITERSAHGIVTYLTAAAT